MKVKVKQVINAYKTLGDAKVTKLETAEVVKVVKARKAMRPIVEDYDAFLKDAQDKLKPENWDAMQEKIQKWQQEGENTSLTEAERVELNKAIIGYQKNVDGAVKDELVREVDIDIETLKEESVTQLLVENGWELKKLDEIEIVI